MDTNVWCSDVAGSALKPCLGVCTAEENIVKSSQRSTMDGTKWSTELQSNKVLYVDTTAGGETRGATELFNPERKRPGRLSTIPRFHTPRKGSPSQQRQDRRAHV